MRPHSVDSRKTRKLGKTLLSADVFPFVDKRRLVRSTVFEEMVHEAAEQAIKHRNTTVAKHLLIPFSSTRYFKAIARYLLDQGAVSYQVMNALVTIRLSTATAKRDMSLVSYLEEYEGTIEETFGRGVKVDGAEEAYLDAMESGKRLPGSFEHGKRR